MVGGLFRCAVLFLDYLFSLLVAMCVIALALLSYMLLTGPAKHILDKARLSDYLGLDISCTL